MDPLSISASIIEVVAASGQVVRYLNDFKPLSEKANILRGELNILQKLLLQLRDRIEQTTTEESVRLASIIRSPGFLTDFTGQLQVVLSKMKERYTGNQSKLRKALEFSYVLKTQKQEIQDTLHAVKTFKEALCLATSISDIS